MRIAPYWARAEFKLGQASNKPLSVVCRGFSDSSIEDARSVARRRAERVAHQIAANTPIKTYEYGSGPLAEEVVEKYESKSGALSAAITRNVYGALILNVHDLMFVDIDSPHSSGRFSILRALGISKGKTSEDALVHSIQDYIQENSRMGARLYRTAAGYRLLLLGERFDPAGSHTEAVFKRFSADTLYAKLCRAQNSFRARLTPKPWRIGLTPPTVSFPYETIESQRTLAEWIRRYNDVCTTFATCLFLSEFGESERDESYATFIRKHDELTRATTMLPLA